MLFPAFMSIQQDLSTSATAVQQTVSLFFVANAFMCLWHGVLSDAGGRRKPLLVGLVVLILTSLRDTTPAGGSSTSAAATMRAHRA